MIYLLADGSGIGKKIAAAILESEESASIISNSINVAIAEISENVERIPGVYLIFAGGDDIYLKIEHPILLPKVVDIIKEYWKLNTGFKIDIAWGDAPQEALDELALLKNRRRWMGEQP